MGIYDATVGKLTKNREIHLPGYNFCGPGTRYDERIGMGQRGVDALDEVCRDHDAAYNTGNKALMKQADVDFYKRAFTIAKSNQHKFKTRAFSVLTGGIIKAKHFLNFY